MTRQQAIVLVIGNAVLSLVISLTVVLVFERYRTSSASPAATSTLAEATAASALGESTPITALEATPAPVATYVVKSGDSLGSVAARFGVTLDALLDANGIDNANYIVVGQALVIPSGGTAPVPTHTPRPGPTLAAVSTPGSGESPIAIEAVMDPGEPALEHVRLVNRGTQGIALDGWVLEDEDGHAFVFPNLFLWRNGTVNVHTTSGNDSATDLYWGLTEAVWDRSDETIRLLNPTGEVMAEAQLGEPNAGP
ncbi:MAG: LysM peptidoglycan-binding domain-containing protein [Anaerolineae bacterium]|nr:LysM peptidoglycan-binding domain-containing protein [Anaerolineae bacterium]